MTQTKDLSPTAYEEGYLSAAAKCPGNPYPPGPWRPFRSWKTGWEDYHIGLTYHDKHGGQITVTGYDNLFPDTTRFLVKCEGGVVWSVDAKRITTLVKQSKNKKGALS